MAKETRILLKQLTETDTNKAMAIPGFVLRSLPNFNGRHSVKINLMYGTGTWEIVCYVRKTGPYKKPVFAGGWRNFIICNDFKVGDKIALYKVQDEAGSFHYRVELVEKPAASPSGPLSPPALSLDHEVDEIETTAGTNRTKVLNFQHDQGTKLPNADAPIKEEGATMELDDAVAEDDAPTPFLDHVIAKTPSKIFGRGNRDAIMATLKTDAKSLVISIMGIGMGMGEKPCLAHYMNKEERDNKPKAIDLDWGGSLATHGSSSQAAKERTPYDGVVNLDLTLGKSIIDMSEPLRRARYVTKEERDIKPKAIILNLGGSLAAHGARQVAGEGTPYDGVVNLDLTLGQPIADVDELLRPAYYVTKEERDIKPKAIDLNVGGLPAAYDAIKPKLIGQVWDGSLPTHGTIKSEPIALNWDGIVPAYRTSQAAGERIQIRRWREVNSELTLAQPIIDVGALPCIKEERDIKLKPIDPNGGGSLAAYGTSQSAGQPTSYDGAVNLDLTLSLPVVEYRGHEAPVFAPVFAPSKPW